MTEPTSTTENELKAEAAELRTAVREWYPVPPQPGGLEAELADLRAAVREWLCAKCNYVYPGPPQPGFACVVCPRCGGSTGPRLSVELAAMRGLVLEFIENGRYPELYDRAKRALGR